MSKGTDRYTFRLPQDMMAEVAATIYRRNLHTDREPWELSEFVRVAIREKLAKMERSRKRAARKLRSAALDAQPVSCQGETQ